MPQSSLDTNQWQVHSYMFALHPQFPTFHSSTPPLLSLPLSSYSPSPLTPPLLLLPPHFPHPHSLLHSHHSLLPNMLFTPALPLSPSILFYTSTHSSNPLHSLLQPSSTPPLTSPYPNSLLLLHSPHFHTHLTPLLSLFPPPPAPSSLSNTPAHHLCSGFFYPPNSLGTAFLCYCLLQ